MPSFDKSLVWFRRDLRAFDHAALYHALKQSRSVYCAFIFDTEILDALPRRDRRVEFILAALAELGRDLERLGGSLIVRHAAAAQEIPKLASELGVDAVFVNHDYEPQAIARDTAVASALKEAGRRLLAFKDQAIFEKDEVLSQSARPFSVFTPYKNAWLRKLHEGGDFFVKPYPVDAYADRLASPGRRATGLPSLAALGFEPTNLNALGMPTGASGGAKLLEDFLPRIGRYHETRDFPAVKGPSYLSTHLRFGTVSIRTLARRALEAMHLPGSSGAATWLSELIWRDFYFMILHHHPRVATQAFKPEYDRIRWEDGEAARELFAAWCEARTGYPLVDAAMAQLNQTGYMHNRLRMVTASFLTKDLGLDWRWGEAYFALHLNDFELSSNNGGWQWAASSGCDAQPYFRIFNPVTQSEKFDPEGKFIRRYLPQLARLPNKAIHAPWLAKPAQLEAAGIALGRDYALPVMQHDEARQRTLARYAVVKKVQPETAD
ncbi:deoxyribodipyrimidine photo-lyase [Noviherbaspirillum humi]|uniref:Deoxyribodipyrimidine photo-lyase n=1 Tax=Noviherbaspirillum humi TaxID=1688639 RepID=A0A239CUM0_9BURK|nr:deoxyribodipyrimidine photo-lyase [Noviherbaspirillum humi]SNS23224.1 deoxyribodipyrimidine photo-lyase [Noviherbaspirillum humi]